MKDKVISVHFPKAAGSSLKKSLVAAYGQDAVFFDYLDDPIDPACQNNIDPDGCQMKANELIDSPAIKIVHGRFHPSKYANIKNAYRITFLRHPIDNLISFFSFWKTYIFPSHSIFDYFIKNNLSIVDLATLPAIRYLMSRTYFGNVDMNSFDFIGFQENYTEDLQLLSSLLSIPLYESNENRNTFSNYHEEVRAVKGNSQILETLHYLLKEDINFYETLKNQRNQKFGGKSSYHGINQPIHSNSLATDGQHPEIAASDYEPPINTSRIIRSWSDLVAKRDQAIQDLKLQLAEHEQSNQVLKAQVEELELENQTVINQLDERQEEVLFYALSCSWQVTRPLRKLVKCLRGNKDA